MLAGMVPQRQRVDSIPLQDCNVCLVRLSTICQYILFLRYPTTSLLLVWHLLGRVQEHTHTLIPSEFLTHKPLLGDMTVTQSLDDNNLT
jgi:hypothetical protein